MCTRGGLVEPLVPGKLTESRLFKDSLPGQNQGDLEREIWGHLSIAGGLPLPSSGVSGRKISERKSCPFQPLSFPL